MTLPLSHVRKDNRGASAVEFAFVIPLLLLSIIGTLQIGFLFLAKAGLRQGVNEGARYATIYPAPSDAQIEARVRAKVFGLDPNRIETLTVSRGLSEGVAYVDISMTYRMPLNLVVMSVPPVTLQATRRTYQP